MNGGHVGDERFELALDAGGAPDDDFPFLGEHGRRTVDQGDAELPFEPGDVGRDVGLDGVQRPCGTREGSVFGDGDEGVQLSQVHRRT